MKLEEIAFGVDEAGRGCVIGPLVVGCVAATPKDRQWFSKNNVRDSKIVPPDERAWLAERIRARCWFQLSIAQPHEIDQAVRDRSRTLNGLEMERMAELLSAARTFHSSIQLQKAFVDAPSINAKGFAEKLCRACEWESPSPLIAKHHADATHLVVAAASIIAKQMREDLIEDLKKQLDDDFGCGYPHDEKTRQHLSRCASGAPHIRWTWRTTSAYNIPTSPSTEN